MIVKPVVAFVVKFDAVFQFSIFLTGSLYAGGGFKALYFCHLPIVVFSCPSLWMERALGINIFPNLG
ncbi:hypothetical protein EV682_11575 [Iodobacter fluviatilis]|uniref:Uncharacterized protein n=1 Tax=Iodobacter fluviatilis TaxID=537 RepID=A0A377QCQ4_9NEIS|nr:hypothetical protein EV682_11575 [Iodobacter fluviatilis]STQ91661.1 Uncharacterised protein [Iodobacter fluviatilis]